MELIGEREPFLHKPFCPRGIAFVGISPAEGYSCSRQVIGSLKESGLPAIYPVNPGYSEILGLYCYPNLQAIP